MSSFVEDYTLVYGIDFLRSLICLHLTQLSAKSLNAVLITVTRSSHVLPKVKLVFIVHSSAAHVTGEYVVNIKTEYLELRFLLLQSM
jgi:hypothetical protein